MHKEVELTAELSPAQYKKVRTYLSKNLKRTALQKLFMVRFHKSEKIEPRNPLDVRYKWRNGDQKLVIKKGALGSQSRQELNIGLQKNNFEGIVQLFGLLDYRTMNVMYREIERFENKNIEAAVAKAGPYYFIEVESLGATTQKNAIANVSDFFKKIHLKPMNKNDYQKFIRRLDREVNLNFPLAQFPAPLTSSSAWKSVLEKTVFKK